MKKIKILGVMALFVISMFFISGQADAKGAQNKRLGLGLNLGEPLGFDGRYYFFDELSMDLIVGYGFGEQGFIIQPSFLFNFRNILDYDGPNWSIVPYIGAGFKTGVDIAGANDGDGIAAMRFPLGATWVLRDGTVEISLEFAPGVEFAPETEFDPTGGIGVRYYFF